MRSPIVSARIATSLALVAVVVLLSACSSDNKPSASPASSSGASVAPSDRPAGPAADLSQQLQGGNGIFLPGGNAPTGYGPAPAGYEVSEYVASGAATSYRADGALSSDGRWNFVPDSSASYRTRVVVRRPTDPKRFSGTVVVEWLNVSGGVDAGPDFDTLQEEITRAGDVWVGVSAQVIGVMGGPVLVTAPGGSDLAGKGLVNIDPARYGTLEHPGDGYSFDIYTQVARAIRHGGVPLGGLQPQRLIAAGESQSAYALVTYIDGVAPLTHAFDGYFVHSRGASGLPLAAPGQPAGLVDALSAGPAIFRTDQDVPILDAQTESDTGLLDSLAARQPDDAHFRLWEVAGTAHADAHLLGSTADQLDCGLPVNNGPMHVVAKAALHALDQWIRTGTPPPSAPRYGITADTNPQVQRDADGIVVGGIRTPPVDAPVDALSGVVAPDASIICVLSGSTKPLTSERLAQLYSSRADYLQRYNTDADHAIAAGYVLAPDRDALLAYAQPERVAA
jgi:hypothetical protein